MHEVKKPRKPLIFYYVIVLAVLLVLLVRRLVHHRTLRQVHLCPGFLILGPPST